MCDRANHPEAASVLTDGLNFPSLRSGNFLWKWRFIFCVVSVAAEHENLRWFVTSGVTKMPFLIICLKAIFEDTEVLILKFLSSVARACLKQERPMMARSVSARLICGR